MENSKLPAFPAHDGNLYYAGITKREYFAGIALSTMQCWDIGENNDFAKERAKRAIVMADELLKQLEK